MGEAARHFQSTVLRPRWRRRAMLALLALPGIVAAPVAARAQLTSPPRTLDASFAVPGGPEMTYGIALPAGYDEAPDTPRPLVLALHPGGRGRYYGRSFMQQVIEPGLRSWGAIFVAPDVPDRNWATDASSRAVMALLEHVLAEHAVDRQRILVTGYSMGGRGTWFLATRNADFFTGAIPMAGSPGSVRLDPLSSMPLHAIHSADDEVVPYPPAAQAVERLEAMGGAVQLIRLDGVDHYDMGAYIGPLQEAAEWMWQEWERREAESRRNAALPNR
ncbi:MAG: hypothetical protein GEU90_02880 [Gemmatimonas sp.]|nr:hypothetical protein [Gemmatimonas sp.]